MNRSRFAFAFLSVVAIVVILSIALPACSSTRTTTPVATAVGGYTAPTVDQKLEQLANENASLKEALSKMEERVKAIETLNQEISTYSSYQRSQDLFIVKLFTLADQVDGRLAKVENKANQTLQKAESAISKTDDLFNDEQKNQIFASINTKVDVNNLFVYGAIHGIALAAIPIEGLVYENTEKNGENYFIAIPADGVVRGSYKGIPWSLKGIRSGDRVSILPVTGNNGKTTLTAFIIHNFRPVGTPDSEEIILINL